MANSSSGSIVDFNTLDLDLNGQNEFDFYAAFEKKEYTVTFDVEGNQEQQAVLFEELITVPLYARFNKLGFVTPEIKPSIPTIITPIMPGVALTTPNIEPPTIPGEGPNIVEPLTPSNGSGSNTVSNTGSRNTIITSKKIPRHFL
ncbi:hypothetical protein FZ042_09970 [Listeria monocytogenes]|uniref:hypothetical protein n=1 Tax=Listeria monocytogenes TaxID=1639 RepID=UPI0011EB6116|nr:hypothetical protein [Listeria monocytogenes]TYV64969.1 hypothetical protein FZ042_09970 [Listeria monocytogenes]